MRRYSHSRSTRPSRSVKRRLRVLTSRPVALAQRIAQLAGEGACVVRAGGAGQQHHTLQALVVEQEAHAERLTGQVVFGQFEQGARLLAAALRRGVTRLGQQALHFGRAGANGQVAPQGLRKNVGSERDENGANKGKEDLFHGPAVTWDWRQSCGGCCNGPADCTSAPSADAGQKPATPSGFVDKPVAGRRRPGNPGRPSGFSAARSAPG